jgi:hypothetical protein
MTDKKQISINGLSGFNKKVQDFLRSYLFKIYIDNDIDITIIIKNIKWNNNEMHITTLVDENAELFKKLLTTSKLKITFLNRVGTPVMTESFYINGLKNKYPLEISHEPEPSMLQYRLVFEYQRFG